MSSLVIKVDNLSKQYRLGQIGTGTIRDDFSRFAAKILRKDDPIQKIGHANILSSVSNASTGLDSEYVWALKDINFEVKQGEVLGIIGKNGAGKSTLLKILSKVTAPTTGQVKVKGRIASLLEVGTGFHPELSGRENIFLNGAILGMTKAEIRSKFDEIVDFSGVDKYIDTPVKRYSSGMYVRLAFAVAAHLEPEILIVDEVLAVGDAEFQKKCLGKMKDVAGQGRTVLFVSHNMPAVMELCDYSILLKNGMLDMIGTNQNVISNYYNLNRRSITNDLSLRSEREGDGTILFTKYLIKDDKGRELDAVVSGQNLVFELFFNKIVSHELKNVHFSIKIVNEDNIPLIHLSEYENTGVYFNINGNVLSGVIRCEIINLPLPAGDYYLDFFCSNLLKVFDSVPSGGRLIVKEGKFFNTVNTLSSKYGMFLLKSKWDITEE